MSRTVARRRVFADNLSPDERTRHVAELGKKSNQHRLTLTHDQVIAIAEAYRLLGDVAARAAEEAKPCADYQPSDSAA